MGEEREAERAYKGGVSGTDSRAGAVMWRGGNDGQHWGIGKGPKVYLGISFGVSFGVDTPRGGDR